MSLFGRKSATAPRAVLGYRYQQELNNGGWESERLSQELMELFVAEPSLLTQEYLYKKAEHVPLADLMQAGRFADLLHLFEQIPDLNAYEGLVLYAKHRMRNADVRDAFRYTDDTKFQKALFEEALFENLRSWAEVNDSQDPLATWRMMASLSLHNNALEKEFSAFCEQLAALIIRDAVCNPVTQAHELAVSGLEAAGVISADDAQALGMYMQHCDMKRCVHKVQALFVKHSFPSKDAETVLDEVIDYLSKERSDVALAGNTQVVEAVKFLTDLFTQLRDASVTMRESGAQAKQRVARLSNKEKLPPAVASKLAGMAAQDIVSHRAQLSVFMDVMQQLDAPVELKKQELLLEEGLKPDGSRQDKDAIPYVLRRPRVIAFETPQDQLADDDPVSRGRYVLSHLPQVAPHIPQEPQESAHELIKAQLDAVNKHIKDMNALSKGLKKALKAHPENAISGPASQRRLLPRCKVSTPDASC